MDYSSDLRTSVKLHLFLLGPEDFRQMFGVEGRTYVKARVINIVRVYARTSKRRVICYLRGSQV